MSKVAAFYCTGKQVGKVSETSACTQLRFAPIVCVEESACEVLYLSTRRHTINQWLKIAKGDNFPTDQHRVFSKDKRDLVKVVSALIAKTIDPVPQHFFDCYTYLSKLIHSRQLGVQRTPAVDVSPFYQTGCKHMPVKEVTPQSIAGTLAIFEDM